MKPSGVLQYWVGVVWVIAGLLSLPAWGLSTACAVHTDPEYRQMILGSWLHAEGNKGFSMKVKLNYFETGRIIADVFVSLQGLKDRDIVYGTYEIENGLIYTTFTHETNPAFHLADGARDHIQIGCMSEEEYVVINEKTGRPGSFARVVE
jgi:hypothetical protein